MTNLLLTELCYNCKKKVKKMGPIYINFYFELLVIVFPNSIY